MGNCRRSSKSCLGYIVGKQLTNSLARLSREVGIAARSIGHRLFDVCDVAIGVLRFRVKRRQRRHHRTQHAHRMGAEGEGLEEALHAVLDTKGVMRDAVRKVRELLLVGQFAVNQKVSRFHKELLYPISSMPLSTVSQHAVFAV